MITFRLQAQLVAVLGVSLATPKDINCVKLKKGRPIVMGTSKHAVKLGIKDPAVIKFLETEKNAMNEISKPTVIYMLGAPGMGKSLAQRKCVAEICKSISLSTCDEKTFTAIDPDGMLKRFFENKNEYYGSHDDKRPENEATVFKINSQRLQNAKDKKANYINDGTGRNTAYYHAEMMKSRSLGYNVVLCGVTGNNDLAVSQAMQREKLTGRGVDISYLMDTFVAVTNALPIYLGVDRTKLDFNLVINRALIYDNLILGGEPKLIYDYEQENCPPHTGNEDVTVSKCRLVRKDEKTYQDERKVMIKEINESLTKNTRIVFRLDEILSKETSVGQLGVTDIQKMACKINDEAACTSIVLAVPIGTMALDDPTRASALSKVVYEAVGIVNKNDIPGSARVINTAQASNHVATPVFSKEFTLKHKQGNPDEHKTLDLSLVVPPDFRYDAFTGFESSLRFDSLWFTYRTLFINFINNSLKKDDLSANLLLPLLSTGVSAGSLRLDPELMMYFQCAAITRAVQSLTKSAITKFSRAHTFDDKIIKDTLLGKIRLIHMSENDKVRFNNSAKELLEVEVEAAKLQHNENQAVLQQLGINGEGTSTSGRGATIRAKANSTMKRIKNIIFRRDAPAPAPQPWK